MRNRVGVLLFVPLLAVALSAAAPRDGAQADAADKYVGVWSGTWDGGGGGGGGFELTLQHEKEKPMGGKVAVTGEPEYTATLTSVRAESSASRRTSRSTVRSTPTSARWKATPSR